MITINNLFNTDINIQGENFRIQKIVIPEIQRDYVQGLEEYTNKLNNFLDVLFKALSSEDKCSLDFIYGNINEDGVFEPIDGQQRITTLALLYYYIENVCNENINNNIFRKIVYKTKNTATDFCRLLSKKYFIKYLHENKKNEIISIIKDYKEYYDFYDYDLTIEAMINTLNSIHIKYEKLSDKSNLSFDNISFQIFPMESFNLSDDLYIKMNGRGKQLSSFDNFKADYFKWLEDASDDNIDKLIPDSFGENSIDKLNTLKRKFDTDYIDIFWDYTFENSKNTNEAPDPEKLFFRFINRFVVGKILSIINNDKNAKNEEYKQYINQFLSCNEKFKDFTSDEQNNLIDKFIEEVDTYFFTNKGSKTEDNSIEYFNFDFYGFILSKYNSRLINILDNLSKKDDNNDYFLNKISEYFKAGWKKDFNIFNDFKNYKELFVYNTILSFLENRLPEDYIKKEIQYLSRLVWNVAEQYDLVTGIYKNTYISIANRFDFLSEIYIDDKNNSNNNYDIYHYFIKANKYYNHTGSLKTIIEDEVRKCEYILNDSKYNSIFKELEKLEYIHGMFGFALDKESFNLSENTISNMKQIFSSKDKYSLFIRALLRTINNIDLLKSKIYSSNTIIGQLIIEDIFRENAKCLLEKSDNKEIIDKLKEHIQSKSSIVMNDNKNYKLYTGICTHEGLYRDNKIDDYKIHATGDVYWLIQKDYVSASTVHIISYCSIRYKLIIALKILSEIINENKSLNDYSEVVKKYNNTHYTNRNEHINFTSSNINFILKFELNNIYINDDKHKFSMHTASNVDTNKINDKVICLYDALIYYSNDREDIKDFFENYRNEFIKIINEDGINCFVNPFENNPTHQ